MLRAVLICMNGHVQYAPVNPSDCGSEWTAPTARTAPARRRAPRHAERDDPLTGTAPGADSMSARPPKIRRRRTQSGARRTDSPKPMAADHPPGRPSRASAALMTPAWVTTTCESPLRRKSASAAPTRSRSMCTLSPPWGRACMKSAAQASSSARGMASHRTPSHLPKSSSRIPFVDERRQASRGADPLGEEPAATQRARDQPRRAGQRCEDTHGLAVERRSEIEVRHAVADAVGDRRSSMTNQGQVHGAESLPRIVGPSREKDRLSWSSRRSCTRPAT